MQNKSLNYHIYQCFRIITGIQKCQVISIYFYYNYISMFDVFQSIAFIILDVHIVPSLTEGTR